jgi:hypothetical protein
MCRIVQDVGKLRVSFYLTEICTNLTREDIIIKILQIAVFTFFVKDMTTTNNILSDYEIVQIY